MATTTASSSATRTPQVFKSPELAAAIEAMVGSGNLEADGAINVTFVPAEAAATEVSRVGLREQPVEGRALRQAELLGERTDDEGRLVHTLRCVICETPFDFVVRSGRPRNRCLVCKSLDLRRPMPAALPD